MIEWLAAGFSFAITGFLFWLNWRNYVYQKRTAEAVEKLVKIAEGNVEG